MFFSIGINTKIDIIEKLICVQVFLYILISIFLEGINSFFSKSYNTFFLVLIMFHIGIPITNVLGYQNDYLDNEFYWYLTETTYWALLAIYLTLNSFFVASIFAFRKPEVSIELFNHVAYKLNFLILLFCSFTWIFVIYFFLGIKEYGEFYESQDSILSTVFIYFTTFICLSFLFSLLEDKRKNYMPLLIYIIWGGLAFNIGVRGPVLYPLALALAILVSQKKLSLNFAKVFTGIILLLTAISYKFLERSNMDMNTDISPLAGIREMGGSLRPVYEVNLWIEQGMNYFYGLTYWAPFDRTISSLTYIKEVVPANLDNRLMNVMILDRAGPYGFSIVAEAFINFSFYGTIALGLIVGTFFNYFDTVSKYYKPTPILLVIAYGIFYHVRQSFVGTYGTIVLGIIYIFILFLVSKLTSTKGRTVSL
jgi:hypothetical protein